MCVKKKPLGLLFGVSMFHEGTSCLPFQGCLWLIVSDVYSVVTQHLNESLLVTFGFRNASLKKNASNGCRDEWN